mmetsp:Transcript_24542/g.56575  ORF Transcript_24542/g.56575 Transcript_24542/m.56575 type:complete len:549 (+) Transcript_24542:27-1673(+)
MGQQCCVADGAAPSEDFLFQPEHSLPSATASQRMRRAGSSPLSRTQKRRQDNQPQVLVPDGDLRYAARLSGPGSKLSDAYELTKHSVGRGASGVVYLARPKAPFAPGDVELVAVKTLRKAGLSKKEIKDLLCEVEIYMNMDHVHIARLIQVFDETDNVYLVMEYCQGGSLADKVREQGALPEDKVAETMRQMLSAVLYCHNRPSGPVCHRDLKPANFIFAGSDDDSPLKMVDFGLAKFLVPGGPKPKVAVGTLAYMAPEVLKCSAYDQTCDLWSLGVIAYVLLTGALPYIGKQAEEMGRAIAAGEVNYLLPRFLDLSEEAQDFVRGLLTVDVEKRPTAADALRHCFLPRTSRLIQSCCLQEISTFSKANPLRRASALILALQAGSSQQFRGVYEGFMGIDADRNGSISEEEFVEALQEGLGMDEAEAKQIFADVSVLGDKELQVSEFLAAALGRKLLHSDDAIRRAFDAFDLDGNGTIVPREMKAVIGDKFCGLPVNKLFNDLDEDNNRQVDFAEFKRAVLAPPMSSELTELSNAIDLAAIVPDVVSV